MTATALAQTPGHFPPQASSFPLAGPAGTLEVATDMPNPSHTRAATAIICHPHPLQGGTMRNKVVTMVERALRESGLATVRFNFRGVGASSGTFDDGHGESDDLATVAEWVRGTRPQAALWLAGFSFGSYVALRNAVALNAAALITVAPPVGRSYDFAAIALPACPWLIVQGEEDEVVEPQAVFDFAATVSPQPTLVRMPETSHFFHRRLLDLRGVVKNAVKPWLPPESPA